MTQRVGTNTDKLLALSVIIGMILLIIRGCIKVMQALNEWGVMTPKQFIAIGSLIVALSVVLLINYWKTT